MTINIVKLLLKHDADPFIETKNGRVLGEEHLMGLSETTRKEIGRLIFEAKSKDIKG